MSAAPETAIPQRYWAWGLCILASATCLALTALSNYWLWPAAFFGFFALMGLWDFFQSRQAIRRNYPVIAHLRFILEFIRPEIRQYFLEADRDEAPFSRAQRSIVYQRAKGVLDKRPFGTQRNCYEPHHEWIWWGRASSPGSGCRTSRITAAPCRSHGSTVTRNSGVILDRQRALRDHLAGRSAGSQRRRVRRRDHRRGGACRRLGDRQQQRRRRARFRARERRWSRRRHDQADGLIPA